MHDELFGKRLRAERERRRITLESIAANTKISIGLLRDLENDRLTHWPGGIFRRSFLKSYAAAVGLDPDETLHEFLERYPDKSSAAARDAIDRSLEPVATNGLGQRRRSAPALRLTLADEPRVFAAGAVLVAMRHRVLAALCDLGVPSALAGLAYLIIGSFWAPLGVALLCYLAIGIVVLGNTPGICLLAPNKQIASPAIEVDAEQAGHLSIFEESLIR